MAILLTLGIAGLLTLLDLDRTFYVPTDTTDRAKLWAWWWGFVTLNGLVAGGVFIAVRDLYPFDEINQWLLAPLVGLSYLAVLRLKFSTFAVQEREVPFGIEAFYEALKAFVYKRINRIAKAARDSEVLALSDASTLAELARRVRVGIGNDALLNAADRDAAKRWLVDVVSDVGATEDEKKDALATYLIAGALTV
jgi:hypothetical protein